MLLECGLTVAAAAVALRNSTIIRAEELKHSEVGMHGGVRWGGCACGGVGGSVCMLLCGVGARAMMVSP